MTKAEILSAIVGLIAVELMHLKWIWLEHWSCPDCSVKNLDCGCPHRRLLKYL